MGFYAAVDAVPDDVAQAEARKLESLQAQLAEAQAAIRRDLGPAAKKAGIPIEHMVELVKYKAQFPEEFARLHREVSRAAAEQEAQQLRVKAKNDVRLQKMKDAANTLERPIENESRNGESWALVDARVKLKELRERIRGWPSR
jgi:hypothetical protein